VSGQKADKPRYWLTYLFKDLQVGDNFKPDILHLTFIPWFVTELSDEEVIKSFKKRFVGEQKFDIRVGELEQFKNKRKIAVNLIEPSQYLIKLHQKTLDWFEEIEGRWAVQNPYVGDEYVPHIRRRPGHNFKGGEKISVSSISLIRAFRRGDDKRTVAAKVELE